MTLLTGGLAQFVENASSLINEVEALRIHNRALMQQVADLNKEVVELNRLLLDLEEEDSSHEGCINPYCECVANGVPCKLKGG